MTTPIPVACPHRCGNACSAATEATGVRIPVTDPVCRLTCPKYGGPAGGGPPPDDGGRWAAAMLRYAWSGGMAKVAARYAKPFRVAVPPDDFVAELRAAFADVAARPWCDGIGLTGSILAPDLSHRDVDVVLFVRPGAIADYLTDAPPLPATVGGLKVDVFGCTRRAAWFLILDLADLKLYRSGAYNLADVDPRITVVDVGDQFPAFRDPPAPRPVTPPPRPPADPPHWGRAMWAELHAKRDADPGWLAAFTNRIPCWACRSHWQRLIAAHPPTFGDGWFAWTVDRHNDVNRAIGRPEWTGGGRPEHIPNSGPLNPGPNREKSGPE